MDTDGFIIERSELDQIPLGKDLGLFKIEAEGDTVYMVSLKNYCIRGKDKVVKDFDKDYRHGDVWWIEDIDGEQGKMIETNNIITDEIKEYVEENKDKIIMKTIPCKVRMKGYHEGDEWVVIDVEDNNNIVHKDDKITMKMYEYMISARYKVKTKTSKLVKKFLKQEGNMYRISNIYVRDELRDIV